VSVILAILVVGAIPRFQDTSQRLGAERAAFSLAQLLRGAREQAITRARAAVWVWDASARRAQLWLVVSEPGEPERTAPIEGRAGRSAPVPDGLSVSLTREGSAVECGCVRFFPDGTAEAAELTVGHRTLAYHVSVDAATGQAQLTRGPLAR
jgi:type II secretory pathway pseudopilin PulG